MQNCLDRDEIYQILPGPHARRAGWLRLLHSFTEQRKASLEAVMLTFGRHVVDTVSASLGPWQSEGGVSMNRVSWRLVLSSCTVLSCCSLAPAPLLWTSSAIEVPSVELGPAALLVLSHLFLSLSVLKEHIMGAEEARQS